MTTHCLTSLVLGFIATVAFTSAYPMYAPKRYRWAPYTMPIYNPRPYAPYYDPYPQKLSEMVDIYPQDPYENYRYYQVPYYMPETAAPAAPYYYDEEETPEEGEDKGADDWYQDGNAETNAIFLQNLMLAQMYKDAMAREAPPAPRYPQSYGYPREEDEDFVYGEPVKEPPKLQDEDVSQLRSLVKDSPKRQPLTKSRFTNNKWSPSQEKRGGVDKEGQLEVVMPRPAAPPRGSPFHQRSHQPSVYDAIKKLLNDHSQDQKLASGSKQPQKRSYIPNEDSLVEQLGSLKKAD